MLKGALVALLIIVIVGSMDFEDAVKSQARYCELVSKGVYPDYKMLEGELCSKTKVKNF